MIDSLHNRLVIKHPLATLFFLGLVLIYFSFGLKNFKLDASMDALILENDEDLSTFRQMMMRYEAKEFVFVALESPLDALHRDNLILTRSLRDELSAIPQVLDVISLLDVPLVSNNPDSSLAELATNFKTLRMPGVNLEMARKELTESPFYKDLVVSSDGNVTSLAIYFKPHPKLPRLRKTRDQLLYDKLVYGLTDQQKLELELLRPKYEKAKEEAEVQMHLALQKIRETIGKYQNQNGSKIYLGGLPMIVDDVSSYIQSDLVNFGSGVFIFLVIMLSVIFREARWVLLPFASCFYAGTIMIGLLGIVGWKVTVISSNFIALMLIITMSMNVHLIVRYKELVRDFPNLTQKDLVRKVVQKMARPCFYTAITTIIAFASLVVADIKPVIDFGWMMTIGLIVVFLTSFTLFPCLLLFSKKKVPQSDTPKVNFQFTKILGIFTERHGRMLLIISFSLAILGMLGIKQLEVENSFISYFDDKTDIYKGLALIDKKLGGTTPMEILLKFPKDINEAMLPENEDDDLAFLFDEISDEGANDKNPECVNTTCDVSRTWFTEPKINQIIAVHDYLETIPEIGKVMSLASTIKVAESIKGAPLESFELNIANQRLPAAIREQIIDPYVSFENNEARINARVIDTFPDLKRKLLLKKIENELTANVGLKKSEFEISGLIVLYNNVLQSLFTSQILTLGTVMLGIMITLFVLFKSFTVAVIGIIPNILAACIILGVMGWLKVPLDIMTITIAAITIGIAVDNCIHYLYRFKTELPRLKDPIATMHYCHNNIARALFYTTITIVSGFSILIFSNFIPTILFGMLTALAMVVALLAALTLMPKLILELRPFEKTRIEDL